MQNELGNQKPTDRGRVRCQVLCKSPLTGAVYTLRKVSGGKGTRENQGQPQNSVQDHPPPDFSLINEMMRVSEVMVACAFLYPG